MKLFRLVALVTAATVVIGCASLQPGKVMDSWMGSKAQELILSWGPPTRSTSDGADGTILIYEYDRKMGQIPGRAVRNSDGSVSYTAPQSNSYVATRMFWVHANGVIYNWKWKGF